MYKNVVVSLHQTEAIAQRVIVRALTELRRAPAGQAIHRVVVIDIVERGIRIDGTGDTRGEVVTERANVVAAERIADEAAIK